MSKSLNRVMIIGRLGQNPELKYTPQGQSVCSFSIATDEGYKDQSGNKVERTEWHRIVAWRKLGEIAGQYLKKGSLVYVEGKLQTRNWEKDGQKHCTTEIVASDLNMLGGKNEAPGGGYSQPRNNAKVPLGQQNQTEQKANFEIKEDDLPF